MKHTTLLLAGMVVLGAAAGGVWLVQQDGAHRHTLTRQTDVAGAVYYTCSMHPQVRQNEPGNCPICGMKLVQVQATAPGAASAVPSSVQVGAAMVQNLGLRTAPTTRGVHAAALRAVGSVMVDQTRVVAVQSRSAGFIEQLDVRAEGEFVRRGQRLAALYAPEILSAQEELQLARRSGDGPLTAAAEARLRRLGANPASGAVVPRQNALLSPSDGVVLELLARENEQIAPGMPLMKIADLSTVWIEIEVPEAQSAQLHLGQPAQVLTSLPGAAKIEAQLAYLYPQLQAQTRTLRARLVVDNPGLQLRPGMYVDVVLAGAPGQDALWIPSEAVIRTGTRELVMLAEAAGAYRPAQVRIGREAGGFSEVLEGLSEQEQVVVSGQFLLDSEASLRGVPVRSLAEPAP